LKVWLLGSDDSPRLYTTIELDMFIAIVAAVYFGLTKQWNSGLAALVLAAGWLYMGAINSVV
jgi:hypothetical protein